MTFKLAVGLIVFKAQTAAAGGVSGGVMGGGPRRSRLSLIVAATSLLDPYKDRNEHSRDCDHTGNELVMRRGTKPIESEHRCGDNDCCDEAADETNGQQFREFHVISVRKAGGPEADGSGARFIR